MEQNNKSTVSGANSASEALSELKKKSRNTSSSQFAQNNPPHINRNNKPAPNNNNDDGCGTVFIYIVAFCVGAFIVSLF